MAVPLLGERTRAMNMAVAGDQPRGQPLPAAVGGRCGSGTGGLSALITHSHISMLLSIYTHLRVTGPCAVFLLIAKTFYTFYFVS